MQRRTFLLGMSGLMFSACAGTTQVQNAPNPYAVARGGTGPTPNPPAPAPGPRSSRRPVPPQVNSPRSCGGVYYRVVPGDTLASIERRSGCKITTIRRANRIQGDNLPVGARLWLPGGREVVSCSVPPAPKAECVVVEPPPVRGGGYHVVARRDWGAKRLRQNHDPMNGIRRITLHHTDEVPGLRARSDREVISAIQRYHQDTMGWADIGYHYLVGRDGLIYEGRPALAQGAHSGGANNIQNLGIAMVGNFTDRMPNAAQMTAVQAFLADQRTQHGVAAREIRGHRDFAATECPGSRFYRWLERYTA